jgi:glycosyltransferase involved in cell wall biosynthesis
MAQLKHIFIILPSGRSASPVKGAVALANALSKSRPVSLVTLKAGTDGLDELNDTVRLLALADEGTFPQRVAELRRLIRVAGDRSSVAAVSYCLSADFANRWCRDVALTCSSVRGNLPVVYGETYGFLGGWIGRSHLRMLRGFDHVVSMTTVMSRQVQRYTSKPSPVIGNFVDEASLARFRVPAPSNGPLRFVYVGSMIRGKQPHLLLRGLRALQERGVAARLDAYGTGPLLDDLRAEAARLPIPDSARFHGHVREPYAAVASADAFVLPSVTEGTSRSALEALFLGVPCVLRDVDGAAELIRRGVNGELFREDSELQSMMERAARWSRLRNGARACLTPLEFRQEAAATRLLELLERGTLA